ncbi:DUF1871 family protein [Faecalispora jeddahensis]|uniref:DUF1871 family protein n=1 Tax=Faecalispora jeddahensis TaxID=1414721 RepID=UPI00145BEB69|nr:DUF1871 family protein [Faecalispora jeddahensis]
MDHKMIFKNIKPIIDNWDPIDLLPYSPNDEYDNETSRIANQVEGKSADELAQIVFDVFSSSFNHGVFQKSLNECRMIALKILTTLSMI